MSDWKAGGDPIPVQVTSPVEARDDRSTDRRRDRRASSAVDEDLTVLVTDLEDTLRQLRTEVGERDRVSSRPRSRPDGPALPRPPSPREVLRFTETYTIPTAVAFLEAAIRGLELLGGAIRLLDGRDPRTPGRTGDGGSVLTDVSAAAGERAAASGREALARVDDALAELQRTYEGEPTDPTARRLLADARELRGEIDDRLSAMERSGTADRDDRDGVNGADRGPTVDVDAELASLREQAGRDEDTDEPEDDDSAADDGGSPADDGDDGF